MSVTVIVVSLPRAVGSLIVVAAVACALAGCRTPTPSQAQREATEMLEEIVGVAAADLPPAASGEPSLVEQCAWLPEWPTSQRAWELWRRYRIGGVQAAERVQRVLNHARTRGGTIVYEHADPEGGRSARIQLNQLDLFAIAGDQFELRVRSRCFVP